MKKWRKLFFMAQVSIIVVQASAQADTNSVKKAIIASAGTMITAINRNDYATIVKFTNDSLVKQLGGAEKYAEMVQAFNELAVVTLEFDEDSTYKNTINFSTGRVLQVVRTANGFQCFLEKVVIVKRKNQTKKAVWIMFGKSDAFGRNWKFIDLAEDSNDENANMLMQLVPDFDKRLIIPKKVQVTEEN